MKKDIDLKEVIKVYLDFGYEAELLLTRVAAFTKGLALRLEMQDYPPATQYADVSKNVPASLPLKGEIVKTYKGKTVKRKCDGRYWARYTVKGKVYAVYGKTQDECYNKLKQAVKQIDKEEPNFNKATLGEWLDKWITAYKEPKCRPTTIEQMKTYLKTAAPLSNLQLKKITALMLQEFLNNIDKPRKREKIYGYLKDAFTKAYKTRLIDYNPFEAIEPTKRQRKESRSLTHEEERLFIEACKMCKQGDLFLLCLYQGLRLGEAVALTYEDIDFERRTITINKSVNTDGEIMPPKTEASKRIIPLFERSLALLDRNGTGKVFKYGRKVYQNSMLKICKALNFKNVSVHTLRHTFATRCSEAGIPPKMVQKWLGHSTVEMTLNIYTHINADYEQEMTSKFDTFFDTFEK